MSSGVTDCAHIDDKVVLSNPSQKLNVPIAHRLSVTVGAVGVGVGVGLGAVGVGAGIGAGIGLGVGEGFGAGFGVGPGAGVASVASGTVPTEFTELLEVS